MLGAEHVTVQVRDPLPPRGGDVQMRNRFLQMGRDAVPVEIGKALDQVRWRRVTELTVQPDLLELLEQRVGLLEVERIAELPDQIGSLDQPPLPIFHRGA